MSGSRIRNAMRGQALVEALLLLAAVGVLLHGMATIGTVQWRGLQAAQLGRLAAFAASRGQPHTTPWPNSLITAERSGFTDAHMQAGSTQVIALARDWLQADPALQGASARVYAPYTSPFVRHDEPAALLPVQRRTVLMRNAGHAHGIAATAERLLLSGAGWQDAARQSRRAAEALYRRMRPVDAPWGRGEWSTDWLARWAYLAPSRVGR